MKSSSIKIIVLDHVATENKHYAAIPSIEKILEKITLKTQSVQTEIIQNSLLSQLSILRELILELEKAPKPRPSRITISLGLTNEGEVGILSTIGSSASTSSSILLEFTLSED